MTELRAEIHIERPPAEVFSFLSDPENDPFWQRRMRRCTITTPPPLGVGSRYEQVARFGRRDIVSTIEIVEYVVGRVIEGTTVKGSFNVTFRQRVEAEGSGTRVTAVITGDSTMFRVGRGLGRRRAQRSLTTDYRQLKEILEAL